MITAGVDEAGRGPLAGPVVCAAVILPPDDGLIGLDDSKKLGEGRREQLFETIQEIAIAHCIHFVDAATIDRMNILQATLHGMRLAIHGLDVAPELVLIDGNRLPPDLPCPARALVGGDGLERSIMAASILAKVSRDRHLRALDARFPAYGFARNKGYPTAEHLAALLRHGPCPEHRRSYGPVQQVSLFAPD
ncbi:ribonuclease HII [Arenimonas sp. GDDSR-1]|uniref:ribonuclease HII n=1 Tax=Arenimonas sp. GDDSR-1 TaxID=2950125 RepID=UPI002620B900|nr:ribonuclease HII [Arenimonas sp. GDDSR-1]